MVYLEINTKNASTNLELINQLNSHLTHKDSKIFILFYMEGCGPCNATRPEWSKLKNVLSNDILTNKDIVIVSIDKDLSSKLKNIGREPNSFPTIRYISNEGKINQNYEDSDISLKDRTVDSFVEWVKLKSGTPTDIANSYSSKQKKNRSYKKKKQNGGKWSRKYKRSINCKRPRGFSQKQYCKYSRRK
jgi:thiol-disulfide isomerase/thioredoxin